MEIVGVCLQQAHQLGLEYQRQVIQAVLAKSKGDAQQRESIADACVSSSVIPLQLLQLSNIETFVPANVHQDLDASIELQQ